MVFSFLTLPPGVREQIELAKRRAAGDILKTSNMQTTAKKASDTGLEDTSTKSEPESTTKEPAPKISTPKISQKTYRARQQTTDSRMFSDKGLLKKIVLRGSSLRGKYQELAKKAGIENMQFDQKGFREATDQIKEFREGQLAAALSLNEQIAQLEAEKAEKSVNKIEQDSRKEWSDFTTKRLKNTGVGYGPTGAADYQKVQQAAVTYQGYADKAQEKIEEIEGQVEAANRNLQSWRLDHNKKMSDYRSLAGLDNFTDAYLQARNSNIGRSELLNRLATQENSRATQVQSELSRSITEHNKLIDDYNAVVARREKIKSEWDDNREKRWGLWRSNLWQEEMAKQGGKYLSKGWQANPAEGQRYQRLAKAENEARTKYWNDLSTTAKEGAKAIRAGFDVEGWRLQKDAEEAGYKFI